MKGEEEKLRKVEIEDCDYTGCPFYDYENIFNEPMCKLYAFLFPDERKELIDDIKCPLLHDCNAIYLYRDTK
jgi:hypothetical protein